MTDFLVLCFPLKVADHKKTMYYTDDCMLQEKAERSCFDM